MNPLLLVTVVLFFLPATLYAQQQKNIFADPQNLQVLPEDISPESLRNTMKGFATGLGVRCDTCHVGEPDAPLTSYDFAADDKAMKRKARVMMSMLNDINATHLEQLNEVEKADRVAVRCVTCHRGVQQPRLIQDMLDEALAKGGGEAAVVRYRTLKDQYYGSHSYDFSEFTLPVYAEELASRQQAAAAIDLLQVNLETYPESYYTHFTLAELYRATGQTQQAIDGYRRAMELNPEVKGFVEPRLNALLEAGEE